MNTNLKVLINIIGIIGVVLIVGVVGYSVASQRAYLPKPFSSPTPTPTLETPRSGPITVAGEIVCLPKKGTGPQTLECAIGLKGADGRHYGLKNSPSDPEHKFSKIGTRVEVSGVFKPEEMSAPGGSKYDVVGTIDMTSIKEAGQ